MNCNKCFVTKSALIEIECCIECMDSVCRDCQGKWRDRVPGSYHYYLACMVEYYRANNMNDSNPDKIAVDLCEKCFKKIFIQGK